MGIDVSPEAQARLCAYLELLGKWNQTYNLTAICDPNDMVSRHLLDSLAVLPFIKGPAVADVGSGAGFPGIPLAVASPALEVVLIESRGKKARFLRQAIRLLDLSAVEVAATRVEDYRHTRKFDTLVSRAFTNIPDLLQRAGKLCASNGQVVVLKGRYPAAELDQLADTRFSDKRFTVSAVKSITVPGLDAERHAVIIAASSG